MGLLLQQLTNQMLWSTNTDKYDSILEILPVVQKHGSKKVGKTWKDIMTTKISAGMCIKQKLCYWT